MSDKEFCLAEVLLGLEGVVSWKNIFELRAEGCTGRHSKAGRRRFARFHERRCRHVRFPAGVWVWDDIHLTVLEKRDAVNEIIALVVARGWAGQSGVYAASLQVIRYVARRQTSTRKGKASRRRVRCEFRLSFDNAPKVSYNITQSI